MDSQTKDLLRRYRRKWEQKVPYHEKLNIPITAASLLVAVMAIVLTVISLRLSYRQTQLSERQMQVAEQQMRFLKEQLERDASLRVAVGYETPPNQPLNPFVVRIVNSGYVPVPVEAVSLKFSVDDSLQARVDCTPEPGAFKADFYEQTVYINRATKVFGIAINMTGAEGDFRIEPRLFLNILRCQLRTVTPEKLLGAHDILLEWGVYSPQREYEGKGDKALLIPGLQLVNQQFQKTK